MDLLLKSGLVTRTHLHGSNVFELKEGARESLDYYRSTILPSLAWPAVVALALREPRSPIDICEAASSWLDLLRIEFFPREGEARLRRLERIRAHLLERGWIREQQGGRLEATAEGARWLEFLRAQLAPLLECYRAAFSAVAEVEGKGQRDSLISLAGEIQREHLVLGEARFPEGMGPVAAGNALWLLVQERVLGCDGVPTRPEASFFPGERWGELPGLELRLAQVLQTP